MATWGGGLGAAFPAEWNARQEVHRGTRRSATSASARDFARDIEVILEEGISLDHAKDSRVRIAALAVSIVGSTALLALQLFDRHRVVDRFGLL